MSRQTCGIPEACICGMCNSIEPEPDYVDPKDKEIERLQAELDSKHEWCVSTDL